MKPTLRSLLLLFAGLLMLAGCASTPKGDFTPDELYSMGEIAFSKSSYETAIDYWRQVRETFPEPELAARAEIGIANAYFLNADYIEAGAAYEEFRRMHPTSDLAQFALYRQGLSSFNLINGIDTDQTPIKNALVLFESFVRQYPNSQYVEKIQDKITDCRSMLAQYEVYVGRYYYRTDAWPAAIGRLEGALANFPDYTGHDETLLYLAKAYVNNKQKDKARTALSRLVLEYPGSKYVGDARKLLGKL